MSFVERRDWERIRYDDDDDVPPPRFVRAGADGPRAVIDCSERGVRYRASPAEEPAVGSDVRGWMEFPGGERVEVEGVVVRHEAAAVALQFTTLWLPRETILAEKRRLRAQAR